MDTRPLNELYPLKPGDRVFVWAPYPCDGYDHHFHAQRGVVVMNGPVGVAVQFDIVIHTPRTLIAHHNLIGCR